MWDALKSLWGIEEPREQCTVVFALIVTDPASECVCLCLWTGCREGGGATTPPCLPPTSRFRNNLCKDDSALFSRFLHALGAFSKPPIRYEFKLNSSVRVKAFLYNFSLLFKRKIYIKVLLASLKTLTNSENCSGSRIKLLFRLSFALMY